MGAKTPEAVHEFFTKAFNAGDIDTLVSLYEPAAAFMPQPGSVVSGHSAIRDAIAGYLALKPTMKLTVRTAMVSGDVALLLSDWTLDGTDPEGKPVALAGTTTDVVRKQSDGTWLYAIDNPFGGAPK